MRCPHCKKEINANDGKQYYSEYVQMKPGQYNKLLEIYGYKQAVNLIFTLDLAITNQLRKPYKCHYSAILSWVVEKIKAVPVNGKTANPLLKNIPQRKQQAPPPIEIIVKEKEGGDLNGN